MTLEKMERDQDARKKDVAMLLRQKADIEQALQNLRNDIHDWGVRIERSRARKERN